MPWRVRRVRWPRPTIRITPGVRDTWREQDPRLPMGDETVTPIDVVILGRIGYDLYS